MYISLWGTEHKVLKQCCCKKKKKKNNKQILVAYAPWLSSTVNFS